MGSGCIVNFPAPKSPGYFREYRGASRDRKQWAIESIRDMYLMGMFLNLWDPPYYGGTRRGSDLRPRICLMRNEREGQWTRMLMLVDQPVSAFLLVLWPLVSPSNHTYKIQLRKLENSRNFQEACGLCYVKFWDRSWCNQTINLKNFFPHTDTHTHTKIESGIYNPFSNLSF